MKAKLLLISFILFGLAVNTVNAQAGTQKRQVHRIKEGVRTGDLNRKETRRLATGERKIHHDVRVAKSDGVITPAERTKIRKEEKRESRRIRRARHN